MLPDATAFPADPALLATLAGVGMIAIGLPVAIVMALAVGWSRGRFRHESGAFSALATASLPAPEAALEVIEASATEASALARNAKSPRQPGGFDAGSRTNAVLWGAAVADAAVPVLGVWERWHSVDRAVFQAVEHLTHQSVEGVGDLLRVFDAKAYPLESDHFFRLLAGHVGEWKVEEHLMDAGHTVAMPFASNHPGLDLFADGHPLNVKTWADAGRAAAGHFERYPDIGIVVPHDAAHIPHGALHFSPEHGIDLAALSHGDHLTLVDDALSHADVVSHTHHALDVVGDPGPALHFPWVTLAVSGFREGRLLVKGNTDLARASKNVAVDGAAVGGGGALGAKGGALIGAAVGGPLGAVVGGLIGGIGGAIAGRSVANAVKRAPLDDAKAGYESALAAYSSSEAKVARSVGDAWRSAQTEVQAWLSAELRAVEQRSIGELGSVEADLGRATKLNLGQAESVLTTAKSALSSVSVALDSHAVADLPRWLTWAAPVIRPIRWAKASAYRRSLAQWTRAADAILDTFEPSDSTTEAVWDLVLAAPDGELAASQFLGRAAAARRRAVAAARAVHRGAAEAAIARRRDAVGSLKSRWEGLQSWANDVMRQPLAALRSTSDQYRRELRAAGVLDA